MRWRPWIERFVGTASVQTGIRDQIHAFLMKEPAHCTAFAPYAEDELVLAAVHSLQDMTHQGRFRMNRSCPHPIKELLSRWEIHGGWDEFANPFRIDHGDCLRGSGMTSQHVERYSGVNGVPEVFSDLICGRIPSCNGIETSIELPQWSYNMSNCETKLTTRWDSQGE